MRERLDRALDVLGRSRQVGEALEATGLTDVADADPFTLTKGERQAVAVASALACDPQVLVLDEPTTGLHMEDIATLLGVFRRLLAEGHSLVVIEHNLDVIRAADWIIDLGPEGGDAGGSLVCAGTPDEVMRYSRHIIMNQVGPGGQRKLLELARVLMADPDILVCLNPATFAEDCMSVSDGGVLIHEASYAFPAGFDRRLARGRHGGTRPAPGRLPPGRPSAGCAAPRCPARWRAAP